MENINNFEYLELLSQLEINNEEKEKLKTDISKILTYMKKISELDTENVKPLTHINYSKDLFREDEIENLYEEENLEGKLLENAAELAENMVVVPKSIV